MAKSYYTVTGTSVVWDNNTFTLVIRHRAQPGGTGPYTWYFNYKKGSYRDRSDEETYTAYTFPYSNTKKVSTGSKVYWGNFGSLASSGTLQYVTDYTITVISGGNGKVTGSGTFRSGTSYKITATANLHYKFSHWSDNNKSSSRTISASADKTYTAYFVRSEWRITVASNDTNMGTVSRTNEGWGNASKPVTIEAIPKALHSFVEWSDGSKAAKRTINPSSDQTLTATFVRDQWTISASTNDDNLGQGYVQKSGTNYKSNTFKRNSTVEMYAAVIDPDTTTFIGWTASKSEYDNLSPSFSFTMPSHDVSFVANFMLNQFQLNLTIVGGDYGGAIILLNEEDVGISSPIWWTDTVRLIATPRDDSEIAGTFIGWYENDNLLSTEPDVAFEYEGFDERNIEARFVEAEEVEISLAVEDVEASSAGCDITIATPHNQNGKWYIGHQITTTITSASGFKLVQLDMKVDGSSLSSLTEDSLSNAIRSEWKLPGGWQWGDALTFTLQDESEITAYFAPIHYVIGYELDENVPVRNVLSAFWDSEPITNLNVGEYYDGETPIRFNSYVKLVATGNGGDSFREWYKGETLASTSNEYQVQATEDAKYVAKFGNSIGVSTAADGTVKVYLDGDGSTNTNSVDFTYGDYVTVEATANEERYFSHWEDGSGTVMKNWASTHRFKPTDGESFVAVFKLNPTPCYVMVRNNKVGYGNLTLTAPDGITDTKLTEGQFDSGLADAMSPAVPPQEVPLGGQIGEDTFWLVSDATVITVTCSPLVPGSVFRGWDLEHIDTGPSEQHGNDDEWFFFANPERVGDSLVQQIAISTHSRITAEHYLPGDQRVRLGYRPGSNTTMGRVEVSPRGKNYTLGPPLECDIEEGTLFTAIAVPANGFKFVGWYDGGTLVSDSATFEQESGGDGTVYELHAAFEQDTNAVFKWEGTKRNKMIVWRSKRFVSTRPINMQSARIYGDSYPIDLRLYSASSPDAPVTNDNTASIAVATQDSRRLPMRRAEKYLEIEIVAGGTVQEVAVSTAMEGLL